MNHKRSVVVGGALSALLMGASGAFAVGSGLFSPGAADKVGTFQSIEQAVVSRATPPTAPRSPARPKTSTSTSPASPTALSSHDDDSAPGTTAPAIGSSGPATESHDSEPPAEGSDDDEADSPTTANTQPEHEEEADDIGHESDDGRESDD